MSLIVISLFILAALFASVRSGAISIALTWWQGHHCLPLPDEISAIHVRLMPLALNEKAEVFLPLSYDEPARLAAEAWQCNPTIVNCCISPLPSQVDCYVSAVLPFFLKSWFVELLVTQLWVHKRPRRILAEVAPFQIRCDRGGGKVDQRHWYGVCDLRWQARDEVHVPCAIATQLWVDEWPRRIWAAVAPFPNTTRSGRVEGKPKELMRRRVLQRQKMPWGGELRLQRWLTLHREAKPLARRGSYSSREIVLWLWWWLMAIARCILVRFGTNNTIEQSKLLHSSIFTNSFCCAQGHNPGAKGGQADTHLTILTFTQ